jgi:hypothetical protein
MNWTRFALAVLIGGVVVSLSDWLFMGVFFHARYNDHPEIWRHPRGGQEGLGIMVSTILAFITSAVFALLCSWLHLHTYAETLRLALAIWFIAPLPLIATNGIFLKFHPGVSLSHAAGWVARLCLIAVTMTLVLR